MKNLKKEGILIVGTHVHLSHVFFDPIRAFLIGRCICKANNRSVYGFLIFTHPLRWFFHDAV